MVQRRTSQIFGRQPASVRIHRFLWWNRFRFWKMVYKFYRVSMLQIWWFLALKKWIFRLKPVFQGYFEKCLWYLEIGGLRYSIRIPFYCRNWNHQLRHNFTHFSKYVQKCLKIDFYDFPYIEAYPAIRNDSCKRKSAQFLQSVF